MIVCDTRMGKGVPFLEAREKNHFIRVDAHEWQHGPRGTRRREDSMSSTSTTNIDTDEAPVPSRA